MSRKNLSWVGATALFFGVVGGFIGTVFVFSWMLINQPYLTEKGFWFPIALFFTGYLFGMLVAGFTGASYALLRLVVGAVTECSWLRRVCLGLVVPVLLLSWLLWAGYHSKTEPIRGPVLYALWNGKFQILFLLGCTLITVYLHSMAEKAYGFFSANEQR